ARSARAPAARRGRSPLRGLGLSRRLRLLLLFLSRRPPPQAGEQRERQPELEDLVEPRARRAVCRKGEEDHRDTSKLYAPEASVPMPMVPVHFPASGEGAAVW